MHPALFCCGHSSLPFKFPFQCLLLREALPCAPRPLHFHRSLALIKNKTNNKNLAVNKAWGCLCGTRVWAYSCGAWPREALEKQGVSWISFWAGCKASLQKGHQSTPWANVLMVGERSGPKRRSYPAPFSYSCRTVGKSWGRAWHQGGSFLTDREWFRYFDVGDAVGCPGRVAAPAVSGRGR